MSSLLLTCDDENLASALTIERNGGVLEDRRKFQGGVKRRYWIHLRPAASPDGTDETASDPHC